jgi:hypothetical protein
MLIITKKELADTWEAEVGGSQSRAGWDKSTDKKFIFI